MLFDLSELPVVPREKSDTGATAGENPRSREIGRTRTLSLFYRGRNESSMMVTV